MNNMSNIRFYALCRNKLKILKYEIHTEIKNIFGNQSTPDINKLSEWITEYNLHSNQNSLIDSAFKSDHQNDCDPQLEPRIFKKIKFYSTCRFHLKTENKIILSEIKILFSNVRFTNQFHTWLNDLTSNKSKTFQQVSISKQCADLTDYIVNYETKMKQKCTSLETNLIELNDKYETELAKNKTLKNDVSFLKMKFSFEKDTYASNIKDLESKLKQLQAEKEVLIKRTQTNPEHTNELIKHLKTTLAAYKERFKYYEHKIGKSEHINKQLNESIKNNYEPKLKKQTDQIGLFKKEVKKAQIDLINLLNENKQLKKKQIQLEDLTKEVDSLKVVNSVNEIEIVCLNEKNKVLNEELNTTKIKLDDQVRLNETQTKAYNLKIYKHITDKNNLQIKNTHQIKELKKITTQLVCYKQSNDDLVRELNEAKEVTQIKSEAREIETNNVEIQTEDYVHEIKLETNEVDMKSSEEIIRLNHEIDNLKFELTRKDNLITELLEISNKLEEEMNELENGDSDIILIEEIPPNGIKRSHNDNNDQIELNKGFNSLKRPCIGIFLNSGPHLN